MKIRRTTILLLLSTAAVGCGPEVPAGLGTSTSGPASQSKPPTPEDAGLAPAPSPGSTPTSAGVDSSAVLASIAQNAYQTSPLFTEVTRAPYLSAVAAGTMVREWVSTSAVSAYEAISPEVVGSGATVPVGTTIVRAVLAADGSVAKLTLMFKGPQGYNAALGDWWFGQTDPAGSPLETDAGPQIGKLDQCFSCHIPRSNDAYLFGVPLDDRTAGASGGGGTTAVDSGAGAAADGGEDAGEDGGATSGRDGGGHHHGGRVAGEGEVSGL